MLAEGDQLPGIHDALSKIVKIKVVHVRDKKPFTYPKVYMGQVVWVMQQNSGGGIYGEGN